MYLLLNAFTKELLESAINVIISISKAIGPELSATHLLSPISQFFNVFWGIYSDTLHLNSKDVYTIELARKIFNSFIPIIGKSKLDSEISSFSAIEAMLRDNSTILIENNSLLNSITSLNNSFTSFASFSSMKISEALSSRKFLSQSTEDRSSAHSPIKQTNTITAFSSHIPDPNWLLNYLKSPDEDFSGFFLFFNYFVNFFQLPYFRIFQFILLEKLLQKS